MNYKPYRIPIPETIWGIDTINTSQLMQTEIEDELFLTTFVHIPQERLWLVALHQGFSHGQQPTVILRNKFIYALPKSASTQITKKNESKLEDMKTVTNQTKRFQNQK